MWDVIAFLVALFIGYMLYFSYRNEEQEKKRSLSSSDTCSELASSTSSDSQVRNFLLMLGWSDEGEDVFKAFTEHFKSLDDISEACKKIGMEQCNLIIGIDFSASNEWQGRKSFNSCCLHKIIPGKIYNPYQKVISILGKTLEPFLVHAPIPAFGFGDTKTSDKAVFDIRTDDSNTCDGFQNVLDWYSKIAGDVRLSGKTNFAPVIRKAVDIVKSTAEYHILLIIADGQVNEKDETIDAIVEASQYPLSIIVVGVGDGPWDTMEEFDHRLPKRKFDNFRFVDYQSAIGKGNRSDTYFALQALMEIPDQYEKMKTLGYIDDSDLKLRLQNVFKPDIVSGALTA